ncbi:MAG: flagellar hook capping FlgD N-terminal domain-containing protein [Pseudomonadota bacterium]
METETSPALLPPRSNAAAAVPTPTEDGSGAIATPTERSTAASDFESFLTLLTAQLRNQDPLQPIDSTEFVAQLASFSTVEQLIGTNERLDTLSQDLAAGDLAALAGWIGQEAAATDGRFTATGEAVDFDVPLVEGATAVRAEVVDENGTTLAGFDVEAGEPATWSGETAEGLPIQDITLRLRLVYSANGEVIAERPVPVFSPVIALSGTDRGATLERADGVSLLPSEVAALRAPLAVTTE